MGASSLDTTHYPCALISFIKVTAFLTNEHIIEHALFKIVNLSTLSKIITIMKPMQAVSETAPRHAMPRHATPRRAAPRRAMPRRSTLRHKSRNRFLHDVTVPHRANP